MLAAARPADALGLSEHHPGKIHLLLTDVVMPGMNGRQLASLFAASRPDSRVLFMSGYADGAIVHHGVLGADMAFLPKPVTPEGLLQRVRAVLDERVA